MADARCAFDVLGSCRPMGRRPATAQPYQACGGLIVSLPQETTMTTGKSNGGEADHDAILAQDAVLKFPKQDEAERIEEELFTIPDRLAEDAQAAAQQRSSHDKRIEKLWGIDKKLISVLRYLKGISAGRAARFDRQYEYVKQVYPDLVPQLELPLHGPGSREPEQASPVMDAAPVGERVEIERKDDPARARKHVSPPVSEVPSSEVVPMSSFRKTLEEGNAKVEAKLKEQRKKKGAAGKDSYSVVG
jgi:hypothetical protein